MTHPSLSLFPTKRTLDALAGSSYDTIGRRRVRARAEALLLAVDPDLIDLNLVREGGLRVVQQCAQVRGCFWERRRERVCERVCVRERERQVEVGDVRTTAAAAAAVPNGGVSVKP